MQGSPIRPVLLFALALGVFALGAAPGFAQENTSSVTAFDPPADVCEPDDDCYRACRLKLRRTFRACLDAGHRRRVCRERAHEVGKSCLISECGPVLGCEDRCRVHGRRLLRRCLENGGELEQCRAEARMATEACIEANCSSCICPDIYAPVCGVDGMTYGNRCEASCADVEIDHEGPCRPRCEPILCDVYCEFGHKRGPDGCPTCECNPPPGCKSDTDCHDDQICHEICPMLPCFEGDPNCGTCVGVCLPTREICLCPLVWDPVCGVDGRTYGNACQAACHDVIAEPGRCEVLESFE